MRQSTIRTRPDGSFYCQIKGKQYRLGRDPELAQVRFRRLLKPVPVDSEGLPIPHSQREQPAPDPDAPLVLSRLQKPETLQLAFRLWGLKVCSSSQRNGLKFLRWCENVDHTEWLRQVDEELLLRFSIYIHDLQASPCTKRHYYNAAKAFVKWCQERKWIDCEVQPGVPPRKPKLVERDIKDMPYFLERVSKAPRNFRDLCLFMLETGMRPSEVSNLLWAEVDCERRLITLLTHKTDRNGKHRIIPLSDAAIAIVKSRADNGKRLPFVFTTKVRGNKWTPTTIWRCFSRYTPGVTSYMLRHTHAQRRLEAGVPINVVAAILGHSNLDTVQRYAQTRSSMLADLAPTLPSVVSA